MSSMIEIEKDGRKCRKRRERTSEHKMTKSRNKASERERERGVSVWERDRETDREPNTYNTIQHNITHNKGKRRKMNMGWTEVLGHDAGALFNLLFHFDISLLSLTLTLPYNYVFFCSRASFCGRCCCCCLLRVLTCNCRRLNNKALGTDKNENINTLWWMSNERGENVYLYVFVS